MDQPLVLGRASALAFVTNYRARRRLGMPGIDSMSRLVYSCWGLSRTIVHRALLDDLAPQAHVYAVDHLADDGQVMGDEQVAETQPLSQPSEQVEHLGLHRDVQGRYGLVTHYQGGVDGQRPGDGHPLALTPGKRRRQDGARKRAGSPTSVNSSATRGGYAGAVRTR